ncbi:MAG TPA: pyridoxamine 5'-phosphate oxidase family protein [Egibacteraceae bacterium]|nr:pyridoxamine 5'-phosphate oxidase family protein [Egibacteraceae bacterium]
MDETPAGAPSERARVRQHADRARYGRDEVDAVLDAGVVAHVGFLREGCPVVVPMAYGRVGDTLYLHGGVASRLLAALGDGAEACVTVTLVDGLVLARSAFKHSMNYRSVVAHGRGRAVTDLEEKAAGLRAVTSHNVAGRWDELRPPTRKELAATAVVAFPLTECALKVREGGPLDHTEDLDQPVWAGVVPLRLVAGDPVPAAGAADRPPPRPRPGMR